MRAQIQSFIEQKIAPLFSLLHDKAEDAQIDQTLRAGIEMKGTNLWVLMFAIFIASIGLNVNSTAVIIGAMLISPLMGPIMGIGYGVGIYDFALIKTAFKNLMIAISISLMTSIVYFLISPLNQAQSELLARTTPTIWDVLIALFGGLAGIIGTTRKEKSNIIPGVAIATALMPPLCTAGYGIANGNWAYFIGAFYLFTINSVFIALSSALITRIFHVSEKHFIDPKKAYRIKLYTLSIALLTVVPSIYLAYQLVQEELFKNNAAQFIKTEIASDRIFITQNNIDAKQRYITVTTVGEFIHEAKLIDISKRLSNAGLSNTKLIVRQPDKQQNFDINTLKTDVLGDLYTQSKQTLEKKEKEIQALKNTLNAEGALKARIKSVPTELQALFPSIHEIWLAQATNWNTQSGLQEQPILVLNMNTSKKLSTEERNNLEKWLMLRLKVDSIKLVIEIKNPT